MKITGRQVPHEVLEHYRFRAVELWKEGEQLSTIARFFGLHRVTISYWIAAYKKGGKTALKSRKAPGPDYKLTKKEIKDILTCLKQPATNFGFQTPLWTTKRIQFLIKEQTKKTIHYANVWRLLQKCGLSNQKPEKRALQADPKEAERWLNEEWPKIRAHAKRWQAIIYFVDEAGVSLVPVLGKTWAPKGITPIVKVTGKKGGFCVTSAISPAGRMLFRIEKEKVKAPVHIQFLKQIIRHHPNRKIIVVEDQARPHIAGMVKEFVEGNKKRFALYFLPPYSPYLNPDEQVWKHLKHHKLKAHQIQSKKEFKGFLLSNMRSIQRTKPVIMSFFSGSYVK